MSPSPEQVRQASDPATPGQTLADLAAAHIDLQPVIARNPSTYPGLLDWLRKHGDAAVQVALAARDRGETSAPPPPPPTSFPPAPPATFPPRDQPLQPAVQGFGAPTSGWTEPSRSVPITWLNHDLRYRIALLGVALAGLLDILVGPLISQVLSQSFDYSNYSSFLVGSFVVGILPSLAFSAAIFVLPSRHKNKIIALVLAGAPIAIMFLQFVLSVIQGSYGIGSFQLLLYPAAIAAWLVVRMRPVAAFGLLPIALLSVAIKYFLIGFGFGYGYGYGIDAVQVILGLLAVGVLVGIAWLARLIAQRKAAALTPAEQAAAYDAAQHAARVAHVQQWEAAYSSAHGGERPPPGSLPPMASPTYGAVPAYSSTPAYAGAPGYNPHTNTMAILALVFGLGGGLLGIIFGHLALGQIRRTGEQGHGMAIAGLVFGYIGAGALVILLIVYFATLGRYYY
ncbi:MAG: DUF4190 domain-containing protein [Pseudolysinimonas sp.]